MRLVISLFARPSFIGSASRVLDLFGTLQEYNKPPTPQLADQRAMFDDFRAIGTDLEHTIFESVFGPDSRHLSEEHAVLKSRLQFVRSGSELGVFEACRNPTGHVLMAWEAYRAYGLSALEEALEYGSAILLHSTAIEATVHSRVPE